MKTKRNEYLRLTELTVEGVEGRQLLVTYKGQRCKVGAGIDRDMDINTLVGKKVIIKHLCENDKMYFPLFMGLSEGNLMNQLLYEYKCLINFNDKMQRDNCKFVESYLKFQQRKKREGWENDCISFLNGAINLQKELMGSIARAI